MHVLIVADADTSYFLIVMNVVNQHMLDTWSTVVNTIPINNFNYAKVRLNGIS